MEPVTKKSNPVKTGITVAVSVAVAAVFMWLAFRGMKFAEIRNYFARANYFWVGAAGFFAVLAYWFRAVRWNMLLEPMGHHVADKNSFWAVSLGYLMNLTVPRSGEVARATALYTVEKVPVDKSFGTIILERVVDLVCMLVFLGLTLIFKKDAIVSFYQNAVQNSSSGNQSAAVWLIPLMTAVVVGGALFFILRKKLQQLPLMSKVYSIVDGLLQGVLSIFKLKNPVRFLLYTAGIWFCYYLAAYLICFALPETENFTVADGFFIIVVGTLGMMIPASGGIGAFHFALKVGIGALFLSMGKAYDAGEQAGLAYAFLSHTMQLVITVALGLFALFALSKGKKRPGRTVSEPEL